MSQFRLVFRGCSFLILVAFLAACGSQPVASPDLVQGKWELVTTAKDVVAVTVSSLTPGEYYFDAGTNVISGVYVVNGPAVTMTKPDNPRMGDITWRRDSAYSLTLIRQPPVELSGQRLISSTMTKL